MLSVKDLHTDTCGQRRLCCERNSRSRAGWERAGGEWREKRELYQPNAASGTDRVQAAS